MELMTPAFKAFVADSAKRGTHVDMKQRAEALLTTLLKSAGSDVPVTQFKPPKDGDSLVLLDLVASTLQLYWITVAAAAELQHSQHPDTPRSRRDCLEQVLVLKMMAQWLIALDPTNKKEHPYCCEVHLAQHIMLSLLELMPINAVGVSVEVLATQIMRKLGNRYHLIDAAVDKASIDLRRKCYALAYGEEEGDKAAEEALAERGHDRQARTY